MRRRYGKCVREACQVPRIVARRVFSRSVSSVSCSLTTISVRLQKPLFLRAISPHGLVPSMRFPSRRSLLLACVRAALRLTMPLSPDFES